MRVTNTTETPYLIKGNAKNAEFSVVAPEQVLSIEPVDTAILSTFPESDPDLTASLRKIRRTNEPEQQGNNFCFPTPKNSGEI